MLVAENEMKRQAEGAPPRDLSSYSGWRATASPDNLDLLSLYSRKLSGQYAGMSNALSLEAVRAALDLEGIPREEWSEMTDRLIRLHRLFEEHRPKAN
jgi:hypothetical protein